MHSLGQNMYHHENNSYPGSLVVPRSYLELPMLHMPPETWGVAPSPGLPFISKMNRCGVSKLQYPSESQLFSMLGQYSTFEDLRRWPQLFGRDMKMAKKQILACLFCRERKIGCTRPDADDPDQTCKCVPSIFLRTICLNTLPSFQSMCAAQETLRVSYGVPPWTTRSAPHKKI